MLEAAYYDKLEDNKVRCRLCPHDCLVYPNRVGICYVRQNRGGLLVPLSYGRVSSLQLDPIEKKPLGFFHPGSTILSIGSIGCNLGCPFCQNWRIAHPRDVLKQGNAPTPDAAATVEKLTEPLGVDRLVELALAHVEQGNIGVAYTYNEPLIWFEYVFDAVKAIRAAGLKNVLVTNGFVHEEPLKALLPYIDAINIDIKGFTDDFYRKLGGRLAPVLRAAELAKAACHVELTNLLIPGVNTDSKQITALVDWIADNLGSDTPLHLSRYFPARRQKTPATTPAELLAARDIAIKRLKSVILGNV